MEMEAVKPKKRKRNVDKWKKSVEKKKRRSGEGYVIPKTNTAVPPKTPPTEVITNLILT
jgi:hypothetical protein